jgi:serine/threonine-protein kinase SRPK3
MGNFFAKLLPFPTLPTDQADRVPDQQPDQAPQPNTVSEGIEDQATQLDTISEYVEEQGTQSDTVLGGVEDRALQHDTVSEGIEEGKAAYRLGGFHPVYIGDIFNNRYKVLNKIGYGQYSTVWLVKDLQAR